MPLTALLEKLYARRRFGIRPGVDRVGKLLERLGNPEKNFRTIHVVGTNGKGSTSSFLVSLLIHGGQNVAQFSSPHLVRFTERFRINGSEYSAEKLADYLPIVLNAAPEDATFFEITTALAAFVFCKEGIEIAIMEAGMGGQSDATAAFHGEMTVITPIALDHCAYLGSTLENIAREKAGIIRSGTPVICAEQPDAVRLIIEERSHAGNCLLKLHGRDFSTSRNSDHSFDYQGIRRILTRLTPGLPGLYQTGNAAVALAAAEVLEAGGIAFTPQGIRDGIAATYWPGRMELIPGTPPLLLDGAHNPAGASALAEALREYSYSRLLLVTGVCDDKDIARIYAPLMPLVADVFTVTPSVERALKDTELSRFFRDHSIASRPCGSVAAGIDTARSSAAAEDLILVCGSLFVIGEVKAWLEQVPYTGIRG